MIPNCAVTIMFRIKIGRNEYNISRRIQGQSLIFIIDHS